MNKTNLAIAPKSSQSSLNCKAEIERVLGQINKAEKELAMLMISKKFYTDKDIARKNKLQFSIENLRSLYCALKTASQFKVGEIVTNGNPTPGEVKGLYFIDSHPKVAVLYDRKTEVKYEWPAQLTLVDDSYCEYIWTGEHYSKLIRRGDGKDCVDLEVLAENYNSAINIRDTHIEREAETEDIDLYKKQAVWSKKQYQKITRVNFPEGIKVFAEKLIGTVLPYSEGNPADLQQVKVKLEDETIKQFYPTQIAVYQGSLVASDEQTKIVQLSSKPTIQTIPIADIRRDGGTQQRIRLNHETVEEYAEAMRQGDKFPPVKLRFDGKSYWLTDGFHTIEAAFSIGRIEIEAEVTEGSQRDAILDSVGVNANHGLRRSNGDKRRAVTTLLNDKEWKKWSDREIARRCKVSNTFVSKLRGELTVNVDSDNTRIYTNKYGEVSVMNTENIGSDNKQDSLIVDPGNDNKSTDKQEVLPIDSTDNQDSNCPDKANTVQTSCPDKNLTAGFYVGQVVKIMPPSDRPDKRLVGRSHAYAVITAIHRSSVDLKLFGEKIQTVSVNDIKTYDDPYNPTICCSASIEETAKLLMMFNSKEEIIKAAIAASSLQL